MANEAKTSKRVAIPTLEQFQTAIQRVTSVTSSRVAIPMVGSTYTPLDYRKGIIVQNVGSATVYLGSVTVTADTAATGGIQLGPLDSLNITLDGSCTLYGIVASTAVKVASLEVS